MTLESFSKPFMAAAFAAIMLCGCTTGAVKPTSRMDATLFVIVRHAEKATDDPKDPTLSETGRARALRLAERLVDQRVSAVYATAYRRTQLTAAPTALAHGVEVQTYAAVAPAADFAAELRAQHTAGSVLVVGHSNTVPAIAGALCACEVAPLREDEYDRLITIRVGRNGEAKLEEIRY